MTFITKKYVPRRTFLRGAGIALALPLLDSMIPAQTPLAKSAAVPKSRLGCIYVPHGATMDRWTPAQQGTGFEFTEILAPLEKFRDRLNVVSGLAHPLAGGDGDDAGADHARSAAVFLSGAHPERGSQAHAGITIDQVAAQKIGQDTPLPSIELSIEDVALNCGSGYGCAYSNTISWRNPTLPLPMENNPQVIFERLFGDGSDSQQRMLRKQGDRSILDSITQEVAHLQGGLGPRDRGKVNDYLGHIREIELQIQRAEKEPTGVNIPESPVGIPEAFDDHLKLMYDLQVLAYQADITRISTLMYARDLSPATYPNSGVRDGFHNASHHSNVRASMDIFAKINRYHAQLFGYFLDRLQKTPDGEGTLLDHSIILYGSSMSNGNQHDHDPLPIVVAGGAAGKLKGGRHIVNPPHTPASNLLLTILGKLGIEQESFGDSKGRIDL